MVHAKAEKSGPQPRLASDQRYASLISEFYSFASAMYNATSIPAADRERFAFGQIDSSKNDLPHTLRLSDPDGASLLLYGLGELGEARAAVDVPARRAAVFRDMANARVSL